MDVAVVDIGGVEAEVVVCINCWYWFSFDIVILLRMSRRRNDSFAATKTIPFDRFVLTDRFEGLVMYELDFRCFSPLPHLTECANQCSSSANSICAWFTLVLFLFCHSVYLPQSCCENFGVWDVFCGF